MLMYSYNATPDGADKPHRWLCVSTNIALRRSAPAFHYSLLLFHLYFITKNCSLPSEQG